MKSLNTCSAVSTLLFALLPLSGGCSSGKHASEERAITQPLKPWTVMVFMNGKNNLEEEALENFRQMAAVPRPIDSVNLVVEFGRLKKDTQTDTDWGGVKRYLVKSGTE